MHSPLADRAAASSPPASCAAESSLNPSMQRASGRPLCGVQLCFFRVLDVGAAGTQSCHRSSVACQHAQIMTDPIPAPWPLCWSDE